MGVTFTTIGFVAALAPYYKDWRAILRPPSDAETVALYAPADAAAAAIEAALQRHPLVRELRAAPGVTEARPHLKIPAHLRAHHLTSGLLAGPGRLAVPPLAFFEGPSQTRATLVMHLGTALCGHPGVVHGGALATLLDEGLARCCFGALPSRVAMTARLDLRYRAPVPAGSFVVLRAATVRVEGRKAWVEGRLESLPMREGEAPTVFVEAEGLFIEPRQAKVGKRRSWRDYDKTNGPWQNMTWLFPAAAAG